MMRRFVRLCALSVSVAASALAQAGQTSGQAPRPGLEQRSAAPGDPQTNPPAEPLTVFEPYIGGTWVSERAGRDGATVRTERTYAWTLGGRFLEVREKTTAGERTSHYFAILGVDPATRQLTAWSFTSAGQLFFMRRTSGQGGDAGTLVFESFGEGPLYRMTIRRTAPDRFEEITEVHREGGWAPAGRQAFTRAAP